MRTDQRGFTLIELLIVVAIIGLITAVATPHLLNASNRGKQSGTMSDLRTIVTALEEYAIDNNAYPATTDLDELASVLEPHYIKRLPRTDKWNHRFAYAGDEGGASYTLSSPGRDGSPQGVAPQGAMGSFDADIICVDGTFVQWPAGQQR